MGLHPPDAFNFTGARKGARVMCIALPPAGAVNLGAEPSTFVFNNLHVIGTLVGTSSFPNPLPFVRSTITNTPPSFSTGTMQDTASALDYAKRGLLKPIHEVRGTGRWDESVQALRRGEIAGRIVIDFNKE